MIADHPARRAGHAELLGDGVVVLDLGVDCRVGRRCLDRGGVEARLRGRGSQAFVADRPGGIERVVKSGELAGARGDQAVARGDLAGFREDGQLAVHDAQLGVVLQQLCNGRQARTAEAAIIVEILDDRQVAIGIARPGAADRRQDRLRVGGDLLAGLLVLQAPHRLGQDFWMVEHVIVDHPLDLRALPAAGRAALNSEHRARPGEGRHHHQSSDRKRTLRQIGHRLPPLCLASSSSFCAASAMSCARIQSTELGGSACIAPRAL